MPVYQIRNEKKKAQAKKPAQPKSEPVKQEKNDDN